MHVDYLSNILKFETRFREYKTFCLGCFDVGHFNMVLNIQLLQLCNCMSDTLHSIPEPCQIQTSTEA